MIRYRCNICPLTSIAQLTCNSYVRSRLARHHKWHNLPDNIKSSKKKRSAVDVASGSNVSAEIVDDQVISAPPNDNVVSSKKLRFATDPSNCQSTSCGDNANDPDMCVPVHIYDREESNSYYQKNASDKSPNDGPSFMVGNALTHTMNSYKYLSEGDITLHLMLSKLTASLTRYQRIELAYILNDHSRVGN